MNLLYSLDLIGTFVFAISGALAAADKKFDLFGASVIGLVTALGGGTIRDILIGSEPVGWMNDLNYLTAVGLALIISFVFRKYVQTLRRTLFLFDSIGLGVFTVLGLQKTLNLGLSPLIAVLMGAVSAVFGGVVRDVLCNEVPLIFRREVYATACLAGGSIYLLMEALTVRRDVAIVITVVLIIALRLAAVKNKWYLPTIK
ncbi:MAG: trimeric intracellular cation channel family protein [Bacteroidota bacterium]